MLTSCGPHSNARAQSRLTGNGAPRPALRWVTAGFLLVFAAVLSACGASSKTFDTSTTGTGTTATVTSISVEPANSSLPRGLTRQFTATAMYSDGTKLDVSASVTWASSVTNIAAITGTGVATALNFGTTTITATLGSVTGSATLTVSAATLVSISVTPVSPTIAKGTLQAFTATGIYTDNSTQTITTSVTWSSSNLFVATISNAPGSIGLATAVSGGKATITAALNGATGSTVLTVSGATLQSISVTPANPSIPLGNSQQFTATGVYTDGTTQPLTTAVTWSSSSPAATISNVAGSQGLATAAAVGTATISAAVDGLTGTATLTVTPATLLSIAVTPANPSIPAGLTQAFVATGTYSDGSTQNLTTAATWTSATPAVATISNAAPTSGTATGVAAGMSIITATLGNIVSVPITLTVTAAQLVSIAVTPANPTIVNGATEQFVATGTFTDGTQQVITTTVTWTSGTTAIASISNLTGPPSTQGLATAASPGNTLITATYPGTGTPISGSTTLTVINAFAYAPNIDCVGTITSSVSEYSVGPTGALTQIGTAAAGNCPFAIGITPNNAYAYVANSNGNNVTGGDTLSEYAINADGTLSPLPVATIATGPNPNSVNIDPSGKYVYVANFGGNTSPNSNTVSEFVIGARGELAPNTAGATVVAGIAPAAVAINPANTYAYVANDHENSISQYTIGPNGVLTPMAVPKVTTGGLDNPNYIVVDPTGRYVYVPNFTGAPGGTISQYSIGMDGALTALTPIGATSGAVPRFIAIDATGTYAYTADSFDDQVSQFTIVGGILTPMTPVANVTTGAGSHPNGLTIDATGKYLYVADRGTNAISLFSINPANGSLTPLAPAAPATNPVPAGTFPTNIATTP
jgi:6-phosphogluconolactonase (cycloisomerase 2 family)